MSLCKLLSNGYNMTMNSEPIYLSKQGRLKLEAELKQLKTVERPRIIEEIKRAMQQGDLSENAEYQAAKEAQILVERKIAELEDKLSRVRSIDADNIPSDKVYLFAKVTVKDLKNDSKITYQLVPPEEADVDNDIISIKSPIGAALLGKGVGEQVEIKVPAGIIRYEITEISRN
jgi:transcription elongation factor GreA